MLKDKIGWMVGIIRKTLSEHKELSLPQLTLLRELNETGFNMALGWLFRKSKISICVKEGNQIVFLTISNITI